MDSPKPQQPRGGGPCPPPRLPVGACLHARTSARADEPATTPEPIHRRACKQAPTILLFAALALALLLPAAPAQSVLHMRSGQELKGNPVTVSKDSVTWRLPGASASGMTIPNGKISHIDFPALPEWENAELAFERREFAAAADLFEAFIEKNPRAAFYPAPGNLITRSQRRLLECYRRLGEDKKLAEVVAKLNPLLLPPAERTLPPVLKAWTATARRDWETAFQASEEAAAEVRSPGALAEIAYLRGNAARRLGKIPIALEEFTRARALVVGYDPVVGARSLQGNAELLRSDRTPAAQKQLVGLLTEYARIYGGGQLWDGAPEELKALIGLGQKTAGEAGEETEGSPAAPKPKKDWLKDF